MDLLEAKQEFSNWRQLSFHIDKALDALQTSTVPETDTRLSKIWIESLEEERKRLQAMRSVSPDLQYLALRAERMLNHFERKAEKFKKPSWWQFWKRADRKKEQAAVHQAENVCKRILKKGRHLLRGITPINQSLEPKALAAVHRTPCFLHHPRVFQMMESLAIARIRLGEKEDPDAIVELDRLYKEFADLLHQRDEFSLKKKIKALDRLFDQTQELFTMFDQSLT